MANLKNHRLIPERTVFPQCRTHREFFADISPVHNLFESGSKGSPPLLNQAKGVTALGDRSHYKVPELENHLLCLVEVRVLPRLKKCTDSISLIMLKFNSAQLGSFLWLYLAAQDSRLTGLLNRGQFLQESIRNLNDTI